MRTYCRVLFKGPGYDVLPRRYGKLRINQLTGTIELLNPKGKRLRPNQLSFGRWIEYEGENQDQFDLFLKASAVGYNTRPPARR